MRKILSVNAIILFVAVCGLSWPQGQKDFVKITVINQFPMTVSILVNGKFAGEADEGSSCAVPVDIRNAPFKIEVWGHNNTRVIAVKELEFLAPGKNIIWSTGNVELPPPGQDARPRPVPAPVRTAPASTVVPKNESKKRDVSFVTSITQIDYQGRRVQNRMRTASLIKIERVNFPAKAAYTLSGQSGYRFGKDGRPVFFKSSPLEFVRDLSNDRLSMENPGGSLSSWLNRVNQMLTGLSVKQIKQGNWEETVSLSLGDAFPEMVLVKFWARPLPAPNARWTLVVADSGMITFQPLDDTYASSPVNGRYRSVLVYAPEGNEFLQASASFNLRYREDRFRIDQTQFAADAEGNQILPILDASTYLEFEPEAPAVSTQGPIPSWGVQAARFFDLLHLMVMTAAEGSTNEVALIGIEQGLLDLINHDLTATEKYLGKAAAAELLGDWMKLLEFWHNKDILGVFGATCELVKDVVKDVVIEAIPYGLGTMYRFVEFEIGLGEAVNEQIEEDISLLEPFPPANPEPEIVSKPAPVPEPPPVEVKKPQKPKEDDGGFEWLDEALLLGGLAAGAGTYLLLNDGGEDCPTEEGCKCAEGNPPMCIVEYPVPPECDCFSTKARKLGRTEIVNGEEWDLCTCFDWIWVSRQQR